MALLLLFASATAYAISLFAGTPVKKVLWRLLSFGLVLLFLALTFLKFLLQIAQYLIVQLAAHPWLLIVLAGFALYFWINRKKKAPPSPFEKQSPQAEAQQEQNKTLHDYLKKREKDIIDTPSKPSSKS